MTSQTIDVHHHILPPHYVERMGAVALGAQGSSGILPEWSVAGSLSLMDAAGIETAITSISAPGFFGLNKAQAGDLARSCNVFAADMVQDHPSRFGFFAALPLQSIDAALREVEFAFDQLGADGVCLLSNYDGLYLGDKTFEPLYAELDRRGAVVFMHPTAPRNRVDLPGMSPSMLEFPFDTTRTIASLIFGGVTRRYPAIRWIFSHAGGTLPYLAGRFETLGANSLYLRDHLEGGFRTAVRPLYFDTALSANAVHFASLRALVDDDRIVFGSDYPFGPKHQMQVTVDGLAGLALSDSTHGAISAGNAQALFPRFSRLTSSDRPDGRSAPARPF